MTTKRKGPARTYNPDMIRDLATSGMTHAEVARAVGCHPNTVRRLVDPEFDAKLAAASAKHQMKRRCADCGGPLWNYAKGDLCRTCRSAA